MQRWMRSSPARVPSQYGCVSGVGFGVGLVAILPPVCGWSGLDTDALGEQLAMIGGSAEQQLRGLGPLEEQVGVVLPGEADAAVYLDRLTGHAEERLRAVRLGEAGDHGQLVGALRRRP